MNILNVILLGCVLLSCLSVRQRTDYAANTCEVQKSSIVNSYEADKMTKTLILTVNVDRVTISESRARVKIFVNLPASSTDITHEERHYLGSFSSFPSGSDSSSYVFNFSSYLARLRKEESEKILTGRIILTFLAEPYEKATVIDSFEIKTTGCFLNLSSE